MNFLEALEFAFALVAADATALSQLNTPIAPIKIGSKYYTIEQVAAPIAPPTS